MNQHHTSGRLIKVLVVDDSPVSQKLYRHLIAADPRFELAGTAINGKEAIEAVARIHPDVVSMDIQMPVMDGIEAIRNIMRLHPLPVVVSTSLYSPQEKEIAMKVLEAGAVNIVPKPVGPGHSDYHKLAKNYLNMLRSMSEVKVVRRNFSSPKIYPETTPQNLTGHPSPPLPRGRTFGVIAIGASAGGPVGLKTILSLLEPSLPVPVVIVQHIDPNFTHSYHQWLQSNSAIPVILVEKEQVLLPGRAYLAPGEKHLEFMPERVVSLSNTPAVKGHRPAISKLFSSLLKVYGKECMAALLSGMGADGAMELKMLHDAGAITFAQNRETCLVYGMPGEAVRMGGVTYECSPEEMILKMKQLLNQ